MTNDDRNSRRAFLGRTAGVGTAAFAQRSVRAAGTRPNIIYIHSHDSGRYLQPYLGQTRGFWVRTIAFALD
jgi:hypothetical protein